MKHKTFWIVVTIVMIVVIVIGGFLYGTNKLKPHFSGCTMEAKICPDGSAVGRTGQNCEFAPCPKNIILPKGYTLDSYTIEKTLETACVKASECLTPPEYAMRSNCPYTSLCLKNKCTVVCPQYK
jgi:hypothetical protein